jgi:hypothetical protein
VHCSSASSSSSGYSAAVSIGLEIASVVL